MMFLHDPRRFKRTSVEQQLDDFAERYRKILSAGCAGYLASGEKKFAIGRYQEAIEACNRCLELNQFQYEADAYQLRGNAKLELHDDRGALADYNQFFKLYADGWKTDHKILRMQFESRLASALPESRSRQS